MSEICFFIHYKNTYYNYTKSTGFVNWKRRKTKFLIYLDIFRNELFKSDTFFGTNFCDLGHFSERIYNMHNFQL